MKRSAAVEQFMEAGRIGDEPWFRERPSSLFRLRPARQGEQTGDGRPVPPNSFAMVEESEDGEILRHFFIPLDPLQLEVLPCRGEALLGLRARLHLGALSGAVGFLAAGDGSLLIMSGPAGGYMIPEAARAAGLNETAIAEAVREASRRENHRKQKLSRREPHRAPAKKTRRGGGR